MAYNNAGQRISKTSGSNTTKYTYDDAGNLTSQRVNYESPMVFSRNLSTGEIDGFTYNGGTYWYRKNQQGDVTGIFYTANASTSLYVQYEYDAWGNCVSITGAGASTIGQLNPIRYRGYYYDTETGYYYLNSRYYDPQTGRFLNADNVISGPGESVHGYNLFAYCNNNPVNYSDENGHLPSWATKLIVAVAVVAVVAATAVITVATAGAGTAIAAVAVGAAKGAAIGFAVGAATGAAGGAISHRITTGSWEGAGEAVLNGMAEGALSGAISGAITGGIQGGIGHFSTSGALKPSQVDPRITEALKTLDKTGIKPGQTQISQKAVLAKFNSYNPLTASSSYTNINGSLYVSEGHHTMIANVMKYGKLNSGINMGQIVNDPGVVTNVLWTTLKIMP